MYKLHSLHFTHTVDYDYTHVIDYSTLQSSQLQLHRFANRNELTCHPLEFIKKWKY